MAIETDPVCGKQLDTTDAAARREYRGRSYYFCSQACAERFDASPQQHTREFLPTTCPECGGQVGQDDLVCPHCGMNLVSG